MSLPAIVEQLDIFCTVGYLCPFFLFSFYNFSCTFLILLVQSIFNEFQLSWVEVQKVYMFCFAL